MQAHLQVLQLVQQEIWKPLAAAYKDASPTPVCPHPFKIGDSVWVWRHKIKNLEPLCKGPYTVLLTTPTALKVDRIAAWIQASQVKVVAPGKQSTPDPEWKLKCSQNLLKRRLVRV